MSLYPTTVKRCQHIKVNGMQCGSPALRDSKHCYYHIRYHWPELEALPDNHEWRKTLATLEDANSIQVSLANVMERLVMQEVDHKTAALLLYALQTASMNLKRTSLEPELPTQVVIDREGGKPSAWRLGVVQDRRTRVRRPEWKRPARETNRTRSKN